MYVFKSIKTVGLPYVNIRQLKYNIDDGSINFDLTYGDDVGKSFISFLKWRHLQEIKQTINKEYHLDHFNMSSLVYSYV